MLTSVFSAINLKTRLGGSQHSFHRHVVNLVSPLVHVVSLVVIGNKEIVVQHYAHVSAVHRRVCVVILFLHGLDFIRPVFHSDEIKNIWMPPWKGCIDSGSSGAPGLYKSTGLIDHLHQSNGSTGLSTITLNLRSAFTQLTVIYSYPRAGHAGQGDLVHQVCPTLTAILCSEQNTIVVLLHWFACLGNVAAPRQELSLRYSLLHLISKFRKVWPHNVIYYSSGGVWPGFAVHGVLLAVDGICPSR